MFHKIDDDLIVSSAIRIDRFGNSATTSAPWVDF